MFGLERSLGSRIVTYAVRDPVPERQSRRGFVATERDHEKAEAHGQRGEDTKGGAYPQSIVQRDDAQSQAGIRPRQPTFPLVRPVTTPTCHPACASPSFSSPQRRELV